MGLCKKAPRIRSILELFSTVHQRDQPTRQNFKKLRKAWSHLPASHLICWSSSFWRTQLAGFQGLISSTLCLTKTSEMWLSLSSQYHRCIPTSHSTVILMLKPYRTFWFNTWYTFWSPTISFDQFWGMRWRKNSSRRFKCAYSDHFYIGKRPQLRSYLRHLQSRNMRFHIPNL